ncbi:transcription factor HIVEP3 [Amia ocellicauda]|uniref:transcription factor HIVEP3 n=1 Tax=Amia ocellicauda TaxID=2972642 RepID=UPI0034647D5A
MEAEHSQPTGGERSGGQEQSSSEPPVGSGSPQSPSLQRQRLFPSRSTHPAHGRHHPRPHKRGSLERHYQRLQQQPSQPFQLAGKAETERAGAVWQFTESPGPSGSSYPSSSTSSPSSSGVHPQVAPPHAAKEAQEGVPRRERKPQKPGKYVCQYCSRPCAKPSVLQKHIRSHTGERPYPCAPCGFSFKTKSNLYKHRKSHAHRIKAGLASGREGYSLSSQEGSQPGEDQEEPTEGESTDSEEETGQHTPSSSLDKYRSLSSQKSGSLERAAPEESQCSDESHAVKQRLAMRLSERKRAPVSQSDDSQSFLSPGSKGSTESGYFSRSVSEEQQQVSPPNANAKSYAEIILGKYGRLGQQQRTAPQQQQQPQPSSSGTPEEKGVSFSVPKTQVIEHITKLITINEAVVDTSEIDSVKPRRTSLSRRSSIESPKISALKDPFVFDSKGEVPSAGASGSVSVGFVCDPLHPQFPNVDLLAGQASTVPLLRSHSMPSSAGPSETAGSSSRNIRLSHSFDEQQAVATEVRAGALLPPHHRMLRRQPAIEVPLGTEFIPEEAGSSASASSTSVSDPGRKHRRGPRLYECEACGARCKKREIYEIHRRTCCPARVAPECKRATETSAYQEDRPQMMHYKFGGTAAAMRKRRKQKSLGDDEEPPVFEPGPAPAATSFPPSCTAIPSREEGRPAVENPRWDSSLGAPSQIEPDRRTTWKEISVIQHTSSFEKQEMSFESQESEEKRVASPAREEHQQPPQQQTPKPFSKLVRQPNIQVPEILVTEEPDSDVVLVSPPATVPKEPEKVVEEFQWPQRSQSLAQLPAEKLPPKKKRLRLAEAAQSSGESSFESVSLPRSPSQESNLSHASSRSASFEESGKPDSETQPAATRTCQVTHMLTVPSGHHQHHQPHREMRRSASEQAPTSVQHSAQIAEARSKSFDYGCLSPQHSSAAWRERRKCLLVRQATLGEPEPEEQPPGWAAKAAQPVCLSYHSPAPPPGKPSTACSSVVPDSLAKSLQLHQSPLPRDPQPVFPRHLPTQGHLPRLFPTPGLSEVLQTQIVPPSFLPSAPQLHPTQLHIVERLGLPMQPYPPLLPLQYPTGAAQALYLPLPSGLALQMPVEPFRESKPSPSSQCPGSQHPPPVIAPSLEQLRPVVSLVVPVRLQTNVPTYASAMYTTLSQILVTRAQESACSAVVLCKAEEERLQNPYLKIPTPDFKSYLPLTLPLGSGAGMGSEEGLGPSTAGGNKRMLSPAGSLELSVEAQRQQKRVKEEEEEEEEEEESERVERMEKGRIQAAMEHQGKEEEEQTKEDRKAVPGKAEPFKEEEEEVSIQIHPPRARSPEGRKAPPYPSLHTTTSVSWCYLNYVKPNPSPQRDPQTSVYSSWCISVHNPNLPGLSTKASLSLLRSKQKYSPETYTMATASRASSGKLVPANSRKPRMSEVHTAPVSAAPEVKEATQPEKEEDKRGKREEEASTSKRGEPSRIRIFEGGYKSNEEYVYVRGRGRGKYVCEECGIRCKKPSMLKKHIRTHTDVRPYVCKYCNFAFKTKGNLTKHMKSKAHGKKCQEMGVAGSSLDELEAEEGGGSEGRTGGSEEQEEHQFSDVDDSDDDDDNEDEEEEEESSSHEEPSSSCSPDTRHSTGGRSSQQDTPEPPLPPVPEKEPAARPQDYPSPRRHWASAREASPGSRRALFSRRHWEASPRTFSPSGEGSPLRCLSPGRGLSPVRPLSPGREASPLRCLSPRLELSSPGRHPSPSPERGPSPLRPRSPSRYLAPRALPSPVPTEGPAPYPRAHFSSTFGGAQLHGEPPSSEASEERPFFLREGVSSGEGCTFPPALRLSPSDFPGHVPARSPRDHVFSHLPLHSQQLTRTPYPMIPIGGIQMVQPRPSSHAGRPQNPATTLPLPRGAGTSLGGGLGDRGTEGVRRLADTRESTKVGSPGPSSEERRLRERRKPQDYRVQESEAGTSLSGLCTGGPDSASAGQTPPELVSQTGGEEPPDSGTKQYGSSRTYSQTSTLVGDTTAQTANRSSGAAGATEASTSRLDTTPPRTTPLPGEEGPPAGRHRRRGPEAAGGSTTSVGQNKDSRTGST